MAKKYRVIVKIWKDRREDFKKWHVNDLLKFTAFLDKNHPNWKWFNVFDMEGNQIGNFTCRNKPMTKHI